MTAADRLRQAAEDIHAIAQEHGLGVGTGRDFDLAELVLRLVADALDPVDEEREAA